jgi:hypothetical protein
LDLGAELSLAGQAVTPTRFMTLRAAFLTPSKAFQSLVLERLTIINPLGKSHLNQG